MSALAGILGRHLSTPTGFGGWLLGHAMRVANRRPTALTIAALEIRPGDEVLDLGCGTGDALGILGRKVGSRTVSAVDHAPDMVLAARRRHPTARVALGTFTALPFADESFDRILAANVAYFWQNDAAVLAEIARVLRPGGRMALYVTDAASLRKIGLDRAGTHRLFNLNSLSLMLGSTAKIWQVVAGLGVIGWVATIDKIDEGIGDARN